MLIVSVLVFLFHFFLWYLGVTLGLCTAVLLWIWFVNPSKSNE